MKVCWLLILVGVAATAMAASLPEDPASWEPEPDEGQRTRRSGSGSGGILSYIKEKVSGKIAQIASASSSSGSDHEPPPEYGPPVESYDHKSFDIWSFKRALLSSLLQAVKAIKGGIIALKGQLIKAKGNVIEAKGRFLAAKGEAISEFGKHVATKALLEGEHEDEHPHSHSSAPSGPPSGYAVETVHSGGYSGPPPPPVYGPPPSAPGLVYGAPFAKIARAATPPAPHLDKPGPGEVQAGLLVLKPISLPEPRGHSSHSTAATGHVPVLAPAPPHIFPPTWVY
ncbi:uncharacterized protein LOC126298398 [Schistocerca gregaria]|uniref:uncharacterized protein LOC126298398 n=1 Tax=Schistocerca gregaria TaxID=7010 RepID=UPI00211ED844|nr:uncharacterized protein LOC126298398 [Schistocerca gregaria]